MRLGKWICKPAALFTLAHPVSALAAERMTVDNVVRAETDMTMKCYEAQGGFGDFLHIRKPTQYNSSSKWFFFQQ